MFKKSNEEGRLTFGQEPADYRNHGPRSFRGLYRDGGLYIMGEHSVYTGKKDGRVVKIDPGYGVEFARYKENKQHGCHLQIDKTGATTISHFKDDEKHGSEIFYRQDGTITKYHYDCNDIHGNYMYLKSDGSI